MGYEWKLADYTLILGQVLVDKQAVIYLIKDISQYLEIANCDKVKIPPIPKEF